MNIINEVWPLLLVTFLGISAMVGALALASPKLFSVVAEVGGIWINTPKSSLIFDKSINIDRFVIKHSRKFGFLVIVVVTYLAIFFLGYIDHAWTPYFLLVVFGLSLLMGLSAIIELRGQVSQIESHLADARTDGLTGLANRRAFDEELSRRLSELERNGGVFTLLLIDVDHFKKINDQYGHLAGDSILTQCVADVLCATKRRMDVVTRFGGDEFAVIFPGSALKEAGVAAERLRVTIGNKKFPVDNTEIKVTISLGLAEALPGEDSNSLIKRADSALYMAKNAGRNRCFQCNGDSIGPLLLNADSKGSRA
ncbi:MAG: diguanylate cyclase [Pirellulales bacterium]|nr:diguanylate cyclase [Pirellulales bacterium]